MRIAFVLPGLPWRVSGGYKVVYQYANALVNSGHEVTVVNLCDQSLTTFGLPEFLRRCVVTLAPSRPRWYFLDGRVTVNKINKLDAIDWAKFDCIVATAVRTAPLVNVIRADAAEKYYLIQGFESWSVGEDEIRRTYHLPMKKLVVSRWLSSLVEEETGERPLYLPNPIDRNIFREIKDCDRNRLSVAVMYHPDEVKGFATAWKAIEKVNRAIPGLHVEMFGAYKPPRGLPDWVTYHRNASEWELAQIFNRSAIYLCASVNDGFGLTCLESMSCGCALVATRFLGVYEYATEENACLCDVGDSEALASSAISLLTDVEKRNRISVAGSRDAVRFSLEASSERLLTALEGGAPNRDECYCAKL